MDLATASYTDFVGHINQTNVPPGSLVTVNRWVVHGFVRPDSFAVELGCTTGFNLRELSRLSGCSGVGVDISESSVRSARTNAARMPGGSERLSYEVADGDSYVPSRPATHVLVGAALGFFPDPARTVRHMTSYLVDGGRLLACPYYIRKELPGELVKEAQAVLGITPTLAPYKSIMRAYKDLRISYEERLTCEPETEEEMHHYTRCTTERYVATGGGRAEQYDLVYQRLYRIKQVCNRLHEHHAYSVLVLEYLKSEYPNRYVELF